MDQASYMQQMQQYYQATQQQQQQQQPQMMGYPAAAQGGLGASPSSLANANQSSLYFHNGLPHLTQKQDGKKSKKRQGGGGSRKNSKEQEVKTKGSKKEVWEGLAMRTAGGLTRKELMKNKKGSIVSIRKHAMGVARAHQLPNRFGGQSQSAAYPQQQQQQPMYMPQMPYAAAAQQFPGAYYAAPGQSPYA
jgi:hypothetical protein